MPMEIDRRFGRIGGRGGWSGGTENGAENRFPPRGCRHESFVLPVLLLLGGLVRSLHAGHPFHTDVTGGAAGVGGKGDVAVVADGDRKSVV